MYGPKIMGSIIQISRTVGQRMMILVKSASFVIQETIYRCCVVNFLDVRELWKRTDST